MTSATERKLENWGDMAENFDDMKGGEPADDLIILPPPESNVTEDGVRTTVAYVAEKTKVDGKEIVKYFRTRRKSREVTIKKKRSKAALARAGKLSKFGALQGKSQGPEKGITTQGFDEIYFEFAHEKGKKDEVKEETSQTRSSIINCKNCGGNHWTNRCPNKHMGSSMAGGDYRGGYQDSKTRPNAYVPPGMRGSGGGGPHDDNDPTIRISNIPENATQEDMKQLLRQFHFNKLRLAKKTYAPSGNRGFAFVTFTTIQDAYTAMVKLTGHKYGHMVLKAEWSDNYKKKYPKGVPVSDEIKKRAQAPMPVTRRYGMRGNSRYNSYGGGDRYRSGGYRAGGGGGGYRGGDRYRSGGGGFRDRR